MTTIVDLGKLRFYWAGDYLITTEYELNDVVRYGGNVYVYTNVVRTIGNIPTNTSYWALMVEGIDFVGSWSNATQYYLGNAVAYGSTVYVALSDNINKQPDLFPLIWSQFLEGIQFEGVYSPTTTYQANDVVTFGPSAYIAKQTTNNNPPTNATFWDSFVQGISPEGVYNNITTYFPGDIVAYGANLYNCTATSTGNLPTNTSFWALFVDTIRTRGNWTSLTLYYVNDIVVVGGNTYQCLVQNTSSVAFATDLAAGKWAIFNSGIRWRGPWVTGTSYLVNDSISNGGSNYICLVSNTAGVSFATDLAAGKWQFFAGDAVVPTFSTADKGLSLTVDAAGTGTIWAHTTASTNTFYVSPDGNDANPGTDLSLPFRSIKAAVAAVTPGQLSTIFVKTGTYLEAALPIIVPAGTAIVGDNQRTVTVSPAAGLAADGVTQNNQATMFLMSNASILNRMTFTGMTGWVPGSTASDIRTSTARGIFVALNPASPVSTKSPYIVECSAIGVGAIGALVDGAVQASGFKSMLFHAYTVIADNGVGFWIRNGGRSEIVSCFTYYAYFGYSTSGGGTIRALNGNNSYGTWGAASYGFSATETPLTGAIFGKQLTVIQDPIPTGFIAGSTITGQTSGATGTVTNLQSAAAKVYYNQTSVTNFQNGEVINDGLGNTLTIAAAGVPGVSDQNGFLLVCDGFSAAPTPGASIQIAGDPSAYVIGSVSGTYVNSSSVMALALVQEKVPTSPDNAVVTIRYNFSQIRLTGHDFLSIGTGGTATTNYPGVPTQPPAQGNEVYEDLPGRVYYVSTDQDGNFRVGDYFRVDQGTGTATLNANAFNLSGLSSLQLGSIGAQLGETINEFSSDPTLGQSNPTNIAVPTEAAVKGYVDNRVPQPIPTSVGNTGRALFSTGSGLAFQTLEALPTQTFANGEILFTDGVTPYWDNFTQITGQNTFSFVNGASFPSTTYTGSSQVNASPTFTWGVSYASLPAGISAIAINSSGVLTMTGTFTANGAFNFSVTAVDNRGVVGRLQVRIVVAATNVIPVFSTTASTATVTATPNSPATLTTFQATNTGGGIVYALVSGGVPSWLTLNTSTGAFTGTPPNFNVQATIYNVTVSATAGGITVLKTIRWSIQVALPQGQALFGTNTGVGTFSWTAPAGVTSVCVVCVGSGSWGGWQWSSGGNGGGGLGWRNNIPVTPGTSYTVSVANWGNNSGNAGSNSNSSNSFFIDQSTVCGFSSQNGGGGSFAAPGGGGGTGGNGGGGSWPTGGGGAAGYSGNGGPGNAQAPGAGGGAVGSWIQYSSTWGTGGGGGVGLDGQGASGSTWNPTTVPGAGGGGGSGGTAGIWGETASFGNNSCQGGTYGGGGGGSGTSTSNNSPYSNQARGGQGGVRIIWGSGRAFPSTNTADVTPIS